MDKYIAVFLAKGFEEAEALVTVDMLRRAGIKTVTFGVGVQPIVGRSDISVNADAPISDMKLDCLAGVVLPGGMPGVTNLANEPRVIEAVKYCNERGLLIGAICAAPSILKRLGIVNDRFTIYPSMQKEYGASADPLVKDNNIITACAAGTVFEFSSALIEYLSGADTASKIAQSVCC